MTTLVLPARNLVDVSASAIQHFETIAAQKIVKLSILGGSCAGLKYSWSIIDDSEKLYDDDELIQFDNFRLAIDGASLLYVIGSQIDYISDITGSRIEIHNPNAKASCGCGESFNV